MTQGMTECTQLDLGLDYEGTIQAAFQAFHDAHPEVYVEVVRLTRIAKARGYTKLGISLPWERMRWTFKVDQGDEEFKLNNNYRSRYARLIMAQEPDLADIFETRELKAA